MSDDEQPMKIPITCGKHSATLVMEHFLCPGIHQKCIDVDGDLLTPKAFCIMGEKQRLKDWKNAIRLNGRKSIRKSMDSGELNFYRHKETCTGRCISRHYGTSKYDVKIENLQQANNETAEWSHFVPFQSSLEGPEYSVLRNIRGESPDQKGLVVFPGMDISAVSEGQVFVKQEVCSDEENISETENQGASPCHYTLKGGDIEGKKASENAPDVPSQHQWSSSDSAGSFTEGNALMRRRRKNTMPQHVNSNGLINMIKSKARIKLQNGSREIAESNENKIVKLVAELPDTETLLEDSVSFWQGIQEMGLLEDIIRDAKICLENLKNDMNFHGVEETDARKLSDVVTNLGLVTKIKWRMAEHKTHTENEKERLLQEIEDLKKKVYVSEVQQQAVKRKSDCFDSLLKRARAKTSSAPTSTSSAPFSEPEADSSTALVKAEES